MTPVHVTDDHAVAEFVVTGIDDSFVEDVQLAVGMGSYNGKDNKGRLK